MNLSDIQRRLADAHTLVHILPDVINTEDEIASQLNDISGLLSSAIHHLAFSTNPKLVKLRQLCQRMHDETVKDWAVMLPGDERYDLTYDKRAWDRFYEEAKLIN